MEYVGNMVHSIISSENFKVDIGENLKSDRALSTRSLEAYYTIAKFLHILNKETLQEYSPGPVENFSPDEQNVLLPLQAHTLHIYRELAKRRNDALLAEHENATKLDPAEFVIDVPKLEYTDHCSNRRTVDRRNELLKFSGNPWTNFVIGSEKPKVPPSANKVFDRLLSGTDHSDLIDNCVKLSDDIAQTSKAIENIFKQRKKH
jgi:hypothetical protein